MSEDKPLGPDKDFWETQRKRLEEHLNNRPNSINKKQDWKEKFEEWLIEYDDNRIYFSPSTISDHVDRYFIKPLQQSNEELQEKVNELTTSNMTHEYNEAEADRFRPEYERQIKEPLQKENAELKEENLKLLKEIERLFVKHGYKTTYEVMKSAIKNQK